jgi:hypothetical protein
LEIGAAVMIQLKDPKFWDLSAKNIRFETIQKLDHRFETKRNHAAQSPNGYEKA